MLETTRNFKDKKINLHYWKNYGDDMMTYLLNASGLTLGGSSTIYIYTQKYIKK